MPRDRKVAQKFGDLLGAHVFWVALVVKQNKTTHPVHIGIFGSDGVMHDPQLRTECVKQFGALRGHLFWQRRCHRGGAGVC